MIKAARNFSQRIMNCVVLLLALSLLYGCGAVTKVDSSSSKPSGASSIVVTPATAHLRAGDTQLFTARASRPEPISRGNPKNPAQNQKDDVRDDITRRPVFGAGASANFGVTWSVNGVAGGNATFGSINAKGLYTAPATPPSPNTVKVSATSVAEPSVSTVAQVTLDNPIPMVASLSPNKVLVGSFKLTINGRRFAKGAQVFFGNTALQTTFVSTTQLSAIGTAGQEQRGQVPISVQNPNPGAATTAGPNVQVINAASPPSSAVALTITTKLLPSGTTDTPYSTTLAAQGGKPPYTWTLGSGQLPSGLTITRSGDISGTPTASGRITFSVRVTDSATSPQVAIQPESIALSAATSAGILWSADMETGDLTQWVNDRDGLIDQHGTGSSAVTTAFAHTGIYSAALTLRGDGDNAEFHRWGESRNPAYFSGGLYYGGWFYFPTEFVMTKSTSSGNFYNIFQFLSAMWTGSNGCGYNVGGTHSNVQFMVPFDIDLQNRNPQNQSQLYARLDWGAGTTPMTGPYANSDQSIKIFNSTLEPGLDIPIARWVHFQVYLKQWPHDVLPYQGRLMVWQDGVLIFDLGGPNDPNGGITTKPGKDLDGSQNCTGTDEPSWNAYSDGVNDHPSPIYVDDVVISRSPVYIP